MQLIKHAWLVGLCLLVLAGCRSSSRPGEETRETVNLTCTKPTLEPLEGYPWDLSKDNVSISVAPEPFEVACVYQRSLKKKFELIKVNTEGDLYTVTDRPSRLEVEPDHLILKLHVTNNLSHVLRFHGAVLTLTVDGKGVPIDPQTQNELLRAVLTPYATLDVTLHGPGLSSLKNASTLNFAIYDVITQVDEANNPIKRTTFEWIFLVRPQEITETLPVRVAEQRFTQFEAERQQNQLVK